MKPATWRLTLLARLILWAALACVLFYSAVGLGWYGLKQARDSLYLVQHERLLAIARATEIERLLEQNRRLVLTAIQYDPDGKLAVMHEQALDVHLQQIRDNAARLQQLWNQFQQLQLDDTDRELMLAFDAHYQVWTEDLDAMLAQLELEDFGISGMRVFLQMGAEEGRLAAEQLAALRQHQGQKSVNDFHQAEQRYVQAQQLYLLLAGCGLLLGSLVGWLMIRRLRQGLQAISGQARAIAEGDLSRPVALSGNDEISDLMRDFARMRDNLRALLGGLRDQVGLLGCSSGRVTGLSDSASTLARQQADAVSSMSAAVEQLSVSIDEVRNHAEVTRDTTEQAERSSQSSEGLICQMLDEMRAIADSVSANAEHMQSLERFSAQIGSVIQVINEVAEQTNLLSLNAAIEAARAGEMGRGFAVVAGEVRQLAERTSHSTTEITETVKQIQQGTRTASNSMQRSVVHVEAGVALAGEVSQAVTAIRAGTADVIAAINQISQILTNQSSATREIAREVEGVSVGVRQMSGSAADSADAAVELQRLAGELDAMAQRFRIA
ncbi:methyl-accepting chemotaxis protein [Halopseudomonas maritima]|uniref:methyl-accepting chemotaxis protein n=1 Tax=Halopseudomonas maritima TaxID=2918528 RepID=UPI001EEA0A42|nr:methyl-accepting chemotaxis protein [Halopseudomonas maritima]UJJ31597.1 methyl-accepting chemotaxis protein [Halopseudomonas maritima]